MATEDNNVSNNVRKWTVEPALLLLSTALALTGPVLQNLVVSRFCVLHFGYNASVCDNLQHFPEVEKLVQPRAAVFFMTKSLIEAILPAMLSFVVGPWSDTYGRKPLLMVPLIGHAALYCGLIFFTFQFNSQWPVYLMLLPSTLVALSGGFVSFVTGAFCLISDTSTPEVRAWKMGRAEGALILGLPIGLSSSSYILAFGGYKLVFAVSAALSTLGFIYVWLCVRETVPPRDEMSERVSTFKSLLDKRLILDMVRTCCKPRPGFRRLSNFLVMASLALSIFSFDGEISVVFLYTREKFEWSLREYSLFSSVSVLLATAGTILGLLILSKHLQLPDAPLAAFAFLTKAAGATTMALAPTPWVLYIGSAAGLLGGLTSPLGRTILSKNVPKEDIGKVFSLTSSLDALTPIAAAPIYTLVYNETLTVLPGAFYLLSAAIYVFNVVFLCIVAVIHYKFPTINYTLIEPESTTVQ